GRDGPRRPPRAPATPAATTAAAAAAAAAAAPPTHVGDALGVHTATDERGDRRRYLTAHQGGGAQRRRRRRAELYRSGLDADRGKPGRRNPVRPHHREPGEWHRHLRGSQYR